MEGNDRGFGAVQILSLHSLQRRDFRPEPGAYFYEANPSNGELHANLPGPFPEAWAPACRVAVLRASFLPVAAGDTACAGGIPRFQGRDQGLEKGYLPGPKPGAA